jgi:hypothetical protein
MPEPEALRLQGALVEVVGVADLEPLPGVVVAEAPEPEALRAAVGR